MSDSRAALGEVGERAAVAYLQASGYSVVDCNARRREGEIDIVARSPEWVLVFVEVRSRRSPAGLVGVAAVGDHKQHRIAELADAYLTEEETDVPACSDVITVVVDAQDCIVELEYIERAVEGQWSRQLRDVTRDVTRAGTQYPYASFTCVICAPTFGARDILHAGLRVPLLRLHCENHRLPSVDQRRRRTSGLRAVRFY